MEISELWDKLELDKNSDTDWVSEYAGVNGYEMFRKRVMGRLDVNTPYEDALKIFQEELEKV